MGFPVLETMQRTVELSGMENEPLNYKKIKTLRVITIKPFRLENLGKNPVQRVVVIRL